MRVDNSRRIKAGFPNGSKLKSENSFAPGVIYQDYLDFLDLILLITPVGFFFILSTMKSTILGEYE